MYKLFFKRLLDIFLGIILLIFFFPLMTIIFFIIWIKIGFPIFSQKRPGLNNKIFTIYKFKTLHDPISSQKDENREYLFGNFLRKTGLDELPQLFNVLNNTMSFIGPRPLLLEYLDKYSSYEMKRHLVKPGISGLAQVKATNNGIKLWKKSIKYDLFYVNHISFILDLKITLLTIKLIFFKKKMYKDYKKLYE